MRNVEREFEVKVFADGDTQCDLLQCTKVTQIANDRLVVGGADEMCVFVKSMFGDEIDIGAKKICRGIVIQSFG